MAPSAVSAVQDSHPRTSRTTARLHGPGPESPLPWPRSQAALPAPAHTGSQLRTYASPLARLRTGMLALTGRRTDGQTHRRRDALRCFCHPLLLTPSLPTGAVGSGPAYCPLHIFTPFYKNFQIKNTYFVPSASAYVSQSLAQSLFFEPLNYILFPFLTPCLSLNFHPSVTLFLLIFFPLCLFLYYLLSLVFLLHFLCLILCVCLLVSVSVSFSFPISVSLTRERSCLWIFTHSSDPVSHAITISPHCLVLQEGTRWGSLSSCSGHALFS